MNKPFVLLLLFLWASALCADEFWNASTRRLICTEVHAKNSNVTATAYAQLAGIPGRRVVVDQFDYGMAGDVTGSAETDLVLGDSSGFVQGYTERYPFATQNVAQSTGGYTSPMVLVPGGLTFTVGSGLVLWLKSGTFSGGTVRCSVCAHYE